MKKLLLIAVLASSAFRVHAQSAPNYTNPYEFSEKKLAKLADKGDAFAAFELGNRYSVGVQHAGGFFSSYSLSQAPANPAKAVAFYHKAADLGYADVSQELGLGYRYRNENNNAESLFWMARAGNGGSLMALIELGDTYFFGKGVARDENQANAWFDKALDHGGDDGNAYLEYRLGRLYLARRRSTNTAITLLKQASAKGNTDAMELLGEMNRDGLGGVQRNATFAQQWFDKVKATQARAAQLAQADTEAALAAQQAANAEQTEEVPTPEAQPSVFGALVNALGAATANADPNGIQNTTNQQLNNIQAARERQIAAQQARQAQAAASTAQQGSSGNGAAPITDHNCIGGEKNYNPMKGCLVAGR